MKNLFQVGITYTTVTPESAAIGDYNDSGWAMKSRGDYSLRDIIDTISRNGIEYLQDNGDSLYAYGFTHCSDYATSEDTQECVIVDAKPKNIQRIIKILKNKKLTN